MLIIVNLLINKKTRSIVLLCVCSLIISLLPVLPLLNMQHKLYLYMPSIFFSIIISLIISKINLLSRYYIPVILSICFLYYLNYFNPTIVSEKNWWLQVGKENVAVFKNTQNLEISTQIKEVEIVNISNETNIFNFGPGDYLKLLYNKNLKVILNKDKKNTANQESKLIIDYKQLLK
jgi:hypothetical protein